MLSSRSRLTAVIAALCLATTVSAQQAASSPAMAMEPHGTFTGANKHTVTGSYQLVAVNGGHLVKLGADFNLDGAPDPYVVLSPSDRGDAAGAINLGRLQKPKGAQSYAIPAGTDLGTFSHVLIYCKKYNATLGDSPLTVGDMSHADGMMHHDSTMSH
jgi:hypothetical protein